MFFFLAMADLVVTGGGFTLKGAHNIVEPLLLRRPVLLGPQIRATEYPAIEAMQAGLCRQVQDGEQLLVALDDGGTGNPSNDAFDQFLRCHAGAAERNLKVLRDWLGEAGADL